MRKAEISIQTFFLIFMSILMVGIIVFGFQKIFLVEDQLSEQKRIEIREEIKTLILECEDPLSKGNIKVYELKHNKINGVCIVNNKIDSHSLLSSIEEFKLIQETEENYIALIRTSFDTQGSTLLDYQIIDTIRLDYDPEVTFCSFDRENKGKVEIKIEC